MIHSIEVENYTGDKISIDMRRPEKSGFLVYSITGIGPVKANINTTDIATIDGSIYNSSRLESRNIVIDMLFDEHSGQESIEDIRHKTYKYFPTKKDVILTFATDKRVLQIKGYVESNEPVIFSSQEGTRISIICPNPYFHECVTSKNVTKFYDTEPMFEFPFENNSLDENLIEFGKILHTTEANVKYNGDLNVGITMYLHVLGLVTNITIYNIHTREMFKIYTSKIEALTGAPLSRGDDIIIETTEGNKSITLFRDGEYINIINCIDRKSDWFQLSKGDNVFAYTVESGLENLHFRIENDVLYEGI